MGLVRVTPIYFLPDKQEKTFALEEGDEDERKTRAKLIPSESYFNPLLEGWRSTEVDFALLTQPSQIQI